MLIKLIADSIYMTTKFKDLWDNCQPSQRETFLEFYERRFVTKPEQRYDLGRWCLERQVKAFTKF